MARSRNSSEKDSHIRLLLAAFLIAFSLQLSADELKPFTTDGCSSFPDGTLKQKSLWINCCIRHDLAYWKGGTYQQRLEADLSLEQCVSKVGEPEVAKLMLAGVRVGGSPYWPTSYRWGYGWSYPRGYDALTDGEKAQVKTQLKLFELLIRGIREEILPK